MMLVPIIKSFWKSYAYNVIIFALLVGFFVLFQFYTVLEEQIEKQTEQNRIFSSQYDSLKMVNDSLHAELFPLEVELNRYKITYDSFLILNPEAAKQFQNIMSTQTE